jgi:high-affinity Fe2+/Pb2+ permease
MFSAITSWWEKSEQRFGAWASLAGLVLTVLLAWPLSDFAGTPREIVYALTLVLLCVGGFGCALLYCIKLGRKAR